MKIARVFPRRTSASPADDLAFFGPPDMFAPKVDEVHLSVTFTADLRKAESLAKSWSHVAPVKIGGPAMGEAGGDFAPGMYLKPGYVITSRGCPNRCWFCSVWRREGETVRELPITDGWNVLDDNLLACSDGHFEAVLAMLSRQKHRAEFTGGLEAARLTDWHVERLARLKPRLNQMFFAYDTPDDLEPLRRASYMLKEAGFTDHHMRCYVLIGYQKDTLSEAVRRFNITMDLGYMPMSMLYLDGVTWRGNRQSRHWRDLHRQYARPAISRKLLR